ncbi:MAG: iron-containing alcohol dehydrogenase [Candidatus Margulisiibacteriota bacterium]|jgi:hypothetical protein
MLNGTFYNPTIFFFGSNAESKIGEEIAKYSHKILLHYGKSSFKKYGLYNKIISSLKAAGVDYLEFSEVQPNPRASLVYEGISLCRKENIDFILAVGGGSVIDSAKAISIGVPYEGDFFDFFLGKDYPKKALKLATVLTLPGTGSESNSIAVITHQERGQKKSCANPLMFPVFSVLNPELTTTLNPYNTACGIVDAISHVLERYFTNTTYVDCTDRICEGLIKTLIEYARLVKVDPNNYQVRAEIMWAAKLAHDNTAGFGRKQDWATHGISHEIGVRQDMAHGAIIGVIFPAWMKYVYKTNVTRFIQFASRVFDIDTALILPEQAILIAIEKFQQFLKSIDMPTTLCELGIKDNSQFVEIAQASVLYMPSGTIGNFQRLSSQDIVKILEIAS